MWSQATDSPERVVEIISETNGFAPALHTIERLTCVFEKSKENSRVAGNLKRFCLALFCFCSRPSVEGVLLLRLTAFLYV